MNDLDRTQLNRMLDSAAQVLQDATPTPKLQAIVLRSASGKDYCAAIADPCLPDHKEETALLDRLRENCDTEITQILCVWADGGVDLPSHYFRATLQRLHPENAHAAVFLRTQNGYVKKPLQITTAPTV